MGSPFLRLVACVRGSRDGIVEVPVRVSEVWNGVRCRCMRWRWDEGRIAEIAYVVAAGDLLV